MNLVFRHARVRGAAQKSLSGCRHLGGGRGAAMRAAFGSIYCCIRWSLIPPRATPPPSRHTPSPPPSVPGVPPLPPDFAPPSPTPALGPSLPQYIPPPQQSPHISFRSFSAFTSMSTDSPPCGSAFTKKDSTVCHPAVRESTMCPACRTCLCEQQSTAPQRVLPSCRILFLPFFRPHSRPLPLI